MPARSTAPPSRSRSELAVRRTNRARARIRQIVDDGSEEAWSDARRCARTLGSKSLARDDSVCRPPMKS